MEAIAHLLNLCHQMRVLLSARRSCDRVCKVKEESEEGAVDSTTPGLDSDRMVTLQLWVIPMGITQVFRPGLNPESTVYELCGLRQMVTLSVPQFPLLQNGTMSRGCHGD